jgi:hypothetical protein
VELGEKTVEGHLADQRSMNEVNTFLDARMRDSGFARFTRELAMQKAQKRAA